MSGLLPQVTSSGLSKSKTVSKMKTEEQKSKSGNDWTIHFVNNVWEGSRRREDDELYTALHATEEGIFKYIV